MERHDNIRFPAESTSLVELVRSIRPDVEHVSHTSSDSSQFVPQDWSEIISLVKQRSTRGPVLVTHGTDTMAWTAAALALSGPFPHPVVITGSNVPLDEPGSDGPRNVGGALQTIRSLESGVWVVFGGEKSEPVHVIQAGFATKRFSVGRSLCDVNNTPYAVIEDGQFEIVGEVRQIEKLNSVPGSVHVEFIWPGWQPKEVVGANVLLVVYHSATAHHDVITWAGELVSRGHRVFAATQSEWNEQAYESSEAMRAVGIEITTLPLELAAASMIITGS
jgi:L-asparaginase/Glu-tRNA(Gln) amidotransferase subunit D